MTFWQNESVVITGGGSGIGKALGAGLAQRGARVWLSDVNGDSAAKAASEIGRDAQSLALDVTDADAVASHIDQVAHAHGRIDAVFNNAGIGVGADIRELNLAAEHGVQMNVLCPMAIETPILETDVARDLGASWRPGASPSARYCLVSSSA